jgi:hypothetical protein
MDYYYKYLKYKTKYFELKGGKMEYGLYGFYSHYKDKSNKDILNLRINRKYLNNYKEKNYVHELNLPRDKNDDNIIIQHLIEFCETDSNGNITKYFTKNVKTLEFYPYKNTSIEDENKIKDLINTTYFKDQLDIKNDKVKWTTLNKLKKFRYRGYSDQISKKIIDSYADKATKILQDKLYEIDDIELTTKRLVGLNLTKERTCDSIHLNTNTNSNTNQNPIIFGEYINNKQLLLSNIETGEKYNNYEKIYRDPYLLHDEKLGALSWNMIINKATLNCIMKNDKEIFPIRIVLNMQPHKLYYDNIMDTGKYTNYMGFFLIRFENDSDVLTTNSKPHNSEQEYYIFFVFKNDSIFDFKTYTLTNFRNNIVSWGNVTEKKTVLFHEIIQLMCMHKNNDVYFYLISKNNDNLTNNDFIKSWIHKDHIKYVDNFKHLNFEHDDEMHILVSRHNINDVCTNLKLDKNNIWNKDNYEYIEYNEYKLIQCHFDWYDNNEKFCIKFGNMSQTKKDKLELCITDNKLLQFDEIRYIQPTAKTNISSPDESHKFNIESILNLELQTFINSIK